MRLTIAASVAASVAASLMLAGCATPYSSPPANTAEGKHTQATGRFIEQGPFPVAGLPDQRLTIWLPPGYDSASGRYPVLYMHDGHNLFDPTKSNFNKVWAADKAVMQLASDGTIEPHIIVGIWAPGEDRYRQYLPQSAAEAARGAVGENIRKLSNEKPVVSQRYLEWIADELKPQIDANYRTRTGPQDTAIIGSSMGGLMSCYAAIERPDIFGKAACVSSHWPVTLPDASAEQQAAVSKIWQDWLAAQLGKAGARRIWMDHGTETLDAHYAPYQDAVDASFRAAGWPEGEAWISREYQGAPHEENAWAARLPEIVSWLLSER